MAGPDKDRWMATVFPELAPQIAAINGGGTAAPPTAPPAPPNPSGNGGGGNGATATAQAAPQAPPPSPATAQTAPPDAAAAPPAPPPATTPTAPAHTLPGVGGCWQEVAAWERARLLFIEVMAEANPTKKIDVAAFNKALDAGGTQIGEWCETEGKSVTMLSAGQAASAALGALAKCMGGDAGADKVQTQRVLLWKAALDKGLTQAKNYVTNQPEDAPDKDADDPTVPNVDRCWREAAAMEQALLDFAETLTAQIVAKTKPKIDIKTLNKTLAGGGAEITQWLIATKAVGQGFATGTAASAAIQALVDCMGKDAGADQGAIKALQKQKTTFDQAIAQARQQLRGDDPLEGDGTNADDNVMGDAWAESAKTQEAVRSFAKLASLASGKPVDYDAVMKSIMGDGSAITGWVVAGGDKASLLSAGFAISQAFAETEAKIRGDKTVYYKKADLVKAYRLALDAALDKAQQALKNAKPTD
jgi:hypothetical protein